MPRLGVNIDHIATLRQARGTNYPDPLESLPILVKCEVNQVTCHLREDRRHIQDYDLSRLIQSKSLPVNLELAVYEEIISLALKLKPHTCTFVPEKREEITTEGGLDCQAHFDKLKKVISRMKNAGIRSSLFIDPDLTQIDLSAKLEAEAIELHTGAFCECYGKPSEKIELERLRKAAKYAAGKGLKVFAGHGLNTDNLAPVVTISEFEEYNIGHSIIARAVFVGLERAIREVQKILSGI